MARLFANNASAKLAAAISDTDNTLLLETGSGAKFPSPTGGDFFDLTLTQGTQETSWEIVKVTARVGDTLTIVRAQQGTTAAPWEAGDKAELRVTSGALDGKQDTLVSGTSIKTVNSTSLLGSGDLEVGYRNIPPNSKSAAYTLALDDAGKHILHPSADTTARTFTIPANASVAFAIGTAITFINQNGAGVVTIAITTDTMRLAGAGTTGSRTLAANGVATAIKLTATEWIISGTNLT